jgi:hypothetical protein
VEQPVEIGAQRARGFPAPSQFAKVDPFCLVRQPAPAPAGPCVDQPVQISRHALRCHQIRVPATI